MAVNTASPLALSRSANASEAAVRGVPACTMLRKSLSSEAAASLSTALTWIALATGNFSPASNQTAASRRPLLSCARARTMRADSIPVPQAALAMVLAITIAAYSNARPGRSAVFVSVRNVASWRATVIGRSFLLLDIAWHDLDRRSGCAPNRGCHTGENDHGLQTQPCAPQDPRSG